MSSLVYQTQTRENLEGTENNDLQCEIGEFFSSFL